MHTRSFMHACLVVLLSTLCWCGTPDEWKQRTIYQVLTDRISPTGTPPSGGCSNLGVYCGGTFAGIMQHLDYIQAMGFDAIWISPIPLNTYENYHGYSAQNLNEINPHFGTAQDLVNFISACHARNIWVMLDVVPNHMGIGVPYSTLVPFTENSYYHSCSQCPPGCWISDFQNLTQLRTCQLSGLPDLNQTVPYVATTLCNWVANITQFYHFDGLRVDTCAEMEQSFLATYQNAAGVYAVGEVADSNPTFVASYQGPLSGTLQYPLFFVLRSVFIQQNSLYDLQGENKNYASAFSNLDYLGIFVDNHDQIRFLNLTSDYKLYQNALTYILMAQGIPIVYYGTEQGFHGGPDPNNREPLWTTGFATSNSLHATLTTLVTARKLAQVWNYPQVELYVDANFYSFTRGTTFVATTNVGSNVAQINRTITNHPYPVGQRLCNIFYPTLDCFTISGNSFVIYLNYGESKVYVPPSVLNNTTTGVTSASTSTASKSTTTTTTTSASKSTSTSTSNFNSNANTNHRKVQRIHPI